MQLQSYSTYLAAELRDNPPRLKGQRTRARLLLAAAQVLEERGYHAMRVGDITTQAEVAEGSFYVYFKDKTEISVEALTRFFDDYVAKAMTPATGDTPFARIRSTNRLWFRVCRANPGLMKCVFQVGDYVPEFLQISQKINRRWAEVVAESIQRRRAEDDPDAVRLAGYMLVAMADEIARKMIVLPDESFIEVLARMGAAADDTLSDAVSVVWHQLAYGDAPTSDDLPEAAVRLAGFLSRSRPAA
jgi:AcrR family transcriptional regulator